MKRTIAYIDGYNLYYGLLQKNPGAKWLDPVAFVKALLRSDDLPAKCQLPETVMLANGSTIHRPPAWK